MDTNSNKRQLKLHIISKHASPKGDWVVCADDSGNRWAMSQRQYDLYRFTGMPFIGTKIEKVFLDLLNGRYYPHLSAVEKKTIILKALETFFEQPIENILPNVVYSNLSEMPKQKPVGTTR